MNSNILKTFWTVNRYILLIYINKFEQNIKM